MLFSKNLVYFLIALLPFDAQSAVDVMFHPNDPTLEKIATFFSEDHREIDIAMYNMETTELSPIIRELKNPVLQRRLTQGELKIRIILEASNSEKDLTKVKNLSRLGIEVKRLDSGKVVHHKFGLFKGGTAPTRLVTGSANWSMSSFKNYDENILFFSEEPFFNSAYQKEFDRLWNNSSSIPIQHSRFHNLNLLNSNVFFNSSQFKLNGNENEPKTQFKITKEIVASISKARSTIKIATTRIKLRPVYEALVQAAKRGVKVQIIVSMDEYSPSHAKLILPECHDIYSVDCSENTSYSLFLARVKDENNEGIQVKFKYYNLKPYSYLTNQMHNKFMVIDDETLFTGSFNWSASSEFGHIENLLRLSFAEYPEIKNKFIEYFDHLWILNSQLLPNLLQKINDGQTLPCAFEPMILPIDSIDLILRSYGRKECN